MRHTMVPPCSAPDRACAWGWRCSGQWFPWSPRQRPQAKIWSFRRSASPRAEEGCSCHSAETETWVHSPHAGLGVDGQPIATCETCHGPYTRSHPDDDMMLLDEDSSICKQCHTDTFAQYEHTTHAEANVQCISCHVSHSQDLRVADESLCTSCHKDALKDELHTAHWVSDVSCTNCHMETPLTEGVGPVASANPAAGIGGSVSHDFVSVSARNCVGCHRKMVYDQTMSTETAARLSLAAEASLAPVLRREVDQAETANRNLAILSAVTLGAGIGLGGILGIAFMLVVARFGNRKGDA